jgi:Cd2+/Zn2+-exporting ATPase
MAEFRAKIDGMDCGNCALTLEDGVGKLPGVRRVSVDFTTETIVVDGDATLDAVRRRVVQLGYRVRDEAAAPQVTELPRGMLGFLQFLLAQPRLRIAAIATVVLLVSLPFDAPWIAAAVAIVVGAPVLLKGVRALWFSRRVTIDLLMAIASAGALLIDAAGEAATVMLLYSLGEALEGYSAERARHSLHSLLALQPQRATVLREASDVHVGPEHAHDHADDHKHGNDPGNCAQTAAHRHAVQVAVGAVRVGDRLLIRPGERLPVDGRILSGESSLNEAAVTGESLPVERGVGALVLSGSLNGHGALEIEALRVAADSTIARIAALVELAQAQRSPAERFIDRFARLYTPLVVLLAMVVALVPVLVFGQPLLDSPTGERGWLYRGLALLIVACPCALVISIPVTVVSALTRLAALGVLVKGGAQLDALADLKVLAFDKTGTLTAGRPAVTALQGSDCTHAAAITQSCPGCEETLALAVAVESQSEHPISHAIVAAASQWRVGARYAPADSVRALAGRGIVGRVRGSTVAVGSAALFAPGEDHALDVPEDFASGIRQSSRTVMLVARDGQLVGAIGVEDELRPETVEALAALREIVPPIRTVMLTGDNGRVARRVADLAGHIEEVRADLRPEHKLQAIEALRAKYGVVGMVGDGINDAPALARADVGIAMGGAGSPQAMETADVVLMQDDLRRVPHAVRLSRRARALIKQNIALSLGLKLAFIALMVPGWATLWLAVAADVGATLIVTLNGMRLLRA